MSDSRQPIASIRTAHPAAPAFRASPAAEPFMITRLVHSLSALRVHILDTSPLGLAVHVEGEVATLGWSGFRLNHRVYLRPPLDGIYEADLVGLRPGGGLPDVRTPFEADLVWDAFPSDRLLGLRINSATGSLTAMLM